MAAKIKRSKQASGARRVAKEQPADSGIQAGISAKNRVSQDQLLNRIRERAFLLFQNRGGVHGFHETDWIEAEAQIKRESHLR